MRSVILCNKLIWIYSRIY